MDDKKQASVDWLFHKLQETPKNKFIWYAILEKASIMHEKVIKEYYGEFKEVEVTHEGDSNIEYIKVIEVEYDNGDICKYQIMLEWFEVNKA